MFISVQKIYSANLRDSINNNVNLGILPQRGNPVFYTYLLFDGGKLNDILKYYSDSPTVSVKNKHFDEFCGACFYPGKGVSVRKFDHAVEGKQFILNKLKPGKFCNRLDKVSELLSEGRGITILQLFSDTCHYEAHAREFAIIKALGINNITNVINGTPYGAMVDWSPIEIINFGKMCLYNAMLMCVLETPRIITLNDILLPKEKSSCKDWELQGILQCFLEL